MLQLIPTRLACIAVSTCLLFLSDASLANTDESSSKPESSSPIVREGTNQGGFAAIPLGHLVLDWFLVNLDNDPTSEIAVLITGSPTRVGIFDPGTEAWIDGPHELAVEPEKWTVCDLDTDGVTDYVYSSSLSILSREFPIEHPDTIGIVSVFPRGVVYWGTDSTGGQLIGIADSRYGGTHYLSYLLHVYSVTPWDSCFTLAAGPAFPSASGTQVEVSGKRFVHNFWIDHIDFGTPQWYWRQRFDWVDEFGAVSKTLNLPVSLHQNIGSGFWDTWYVLSADTVQTGGTDTPLVSWMLGIKTYGPSEDPFWTVWGCYADTGAYPLWQVSDSSVNEYLDVVAYDLLPEPGSEIIAPRRSDSTWEIRRAIDGAILQIQGDMPMTDLSTECLLEPDVCELFYIADSNLYIYQPDIQTGVFDDPEVPFLAADAVAISAHPNPFNSAVTLTWSGAASSLTIYNVLGQIVTEIPVDGKSSVTWDGCDSHSHECPSGSYIAQVASRDFTTFTKIVLLR
jgi:hypothetical protein